MRNRLKITATLLAASVLTSIGLSQETPIYSPTRNIKDQNIALTNWGSGAINQADETAYEGAYSLRVTTHNYFQGGFINFASPLDLNAAFADPNYLLRFAFRIAGNNMVIGNNPNSAADQAKPETISVHFLRVIIGTSDGKKSEIYLDVSRMQVKNAWRLVALPLKGINGFEATNKIVTSMAFSADSTSTFYVGDIKLVHDTTEITGDSNIKRELNLARGDEVQFAASGYGGVTVLKYSWDFDNSDGIQEDAVGQVVRRKFRTPGKFVVTLTISDQYGLKKPFVKTMNLTVNP